MLGKSALLFAPCFLNGEKGKPPVNRRVRLGLIGKCWDRRVKRYRVSLQRRAAVK